VVNSLADPGNGTCNATQCTLREAINDPHSTRISFAPGLTGTITLARPGAGGGRLEIAKPLTITGPSQGIVIRGRSPDFAFPVFRIGEGGVVTLTNLTIRNGGDGILNRGTLTVTNCVVAGNSRNGISSSGLLALNHSSVANNSSHGISSSFGELTLSDARIADNTGRGIALFRGSLTLTSSTVARNGGGIANSESRATIESSTIANNSTTAEGGGIVNSATDPFGRSSARLTLTNSTVSGNSAAAGGGIHNSATQENGAVVIVTNSTVARNSAPAGGGGVLVEGEASASSGVELRNSIVAQNSATAGPDVLVVPSGGVFARFSLIGDGTGSGITNTNGNQVGSAGAPIDPRLAPLGDYGGPTRTHRLLLGSPAIDAASSADCPATDQRGVPRPQGAGCDIGSFERIVP
jgi:CSLREA domain-containing protein